jgi:broad specificity phosphatase PhoE
MKLYLVRHGYAFHNLGAEKYGEKAYYMELFEDAYLTEKGKDQANSLKPSLNKIKFSDIYCSPLQRCIQTCDNCIDTNIHILLDDRLMEPQGEHLCNKRKQIPCLKKLLLDMSNKYALYNINDEYKFDKETNCDVLKRITDFVGELKSKYNKNDNILIITHHDWLYQFFKFITGTSYSFKNCELKIVDL